MEQSRQVPGKRILQTYFNFVVAVVDHVQWFRDRAQMQRWEEEIEILEEEFCRTVRSFERMAQVWTQLAKNLGTGPGYAQYAFEHARMYHEMAEDARAKFKSAGGFWLTGCSLSELISQQREARHW